jgi:two-component system response regulator
MELACGRIANPPNADRVGVDDVGMACLWDQAASSYLHSKAALRWMTMRNFSRRTNVLVLEDDADDAILIRRAFTGETCRAFICRNTSEARAYFLGSGMYADRVLYPFPEVFVTDLRLGEESGIQFLAWVRAFENSKDLPVIVLSGAATRSDILAAQSLGATRVLIKPADPIALQDMLIATSRELCPPIVVEHEVSEPDLMVTV